MSFPFLIYFDFYNLKTWWSMLMITTFASGRWLRQNVEMTQHFSRCRCRCWRRCRNVVMLRCWCWCRFRDDSAHFRWRHFFDTQVISVSEYVGFWNPDSDKKLTLFWSTEITRSQCTVQLEDQVSGSLTVEFRRSEKSLLLFCTMHRKNTNN